MSAPAILGQCDVGEAYVGSSLNIDGLHDLSLLEILSLEEGILGLEMTGLARQQKLGPRSRHSRRTLEISGFVVLAHHLLIHDFLKDENIERLISQLSAKFNGSFRNLAERMNCTLTFVSCLPILSYLRALRIISASSLLSSFLGRFRFWPFLFGCLPASFTFVSFVWVSSGASIFSAVSIYLLLLRRRNEEESAASRKWQETHFFIKD